MSESQIQATLDRIDRMRGGDAWVSIQRLEAMWPKDARVSWREAFDAAKYRFGTLEAGQVLDRRVAFMEGILAMSLIPSSVPQEPISHG